jgi:hypothetical protein
MTVADIEQAAIVVAEARAHAQRANTTLAEAEAGRTRISNRIDDLATERGALVAAERSGSSGPGAALRLAVIDEDIRDLNAMIATAEAELAKPRSEAAQGEQRVTAAEWQLGNARDIELEGRLLEYTGRLEQLTLEALRELSDVGQRLGRSRPVWAPSQELCDQLQRLRLTANGIKR